MQGLGSSSEGLWFLVWGRGLRIQDRGPHSTPPKRQGILATDFLQRFEMLETLKYPVLVSNIQRTSAP